MRVNRCRFGVQPTPRLMRRPMRASARDHGTRGIYIYVYIYETRDRSNPKALLGYPDRMPEANLPMEPAAPAWDGLENDVARPYEQLDAHDTLWALSHLCPLHE